MNSSNLRAEGLFHGLRVAVTGGTSGLGLALVSSSPRGVVLGTTVTRALEHAAGLGDGVACRRVPDWPISALDLGPRVALSTPSSAASTSRARATTSCCVPSCFRSVT